MDDQTQRALGELNRRFYDHHAKAFDATRDHPWPGWERVVDLSAARRDFGSQLSVLDVGCGNGRLRDFIDSAWSGTLEYVGVDASDSLLERARERLARSSRGDTSARFVGGDLVANAPAAVLASVGRAEFDLCCAFGVLHHIPGRERRRELLEAMAGHTRRGGLLATSFWRFDAHERFRRRFRDWSDATDGCASAGVADVDIDIERLEVGDHLLAWGSGDAMRYCHAASDDEVAGHIEDLCALGFRVVDEFESDGREQSLNRYVVFENVAETGR